MEMRLVGNIPYLITDEHCLLIDTGSPLSTSRKGYIKLKDRYCFLRRKVGPDTEPGLTGSDQDGVLGMDILKDHSLMLDYEAWEAFIDPVKKGKAAFSAELDMDLGVPRIKGKYRGVERKFILDTGSMLSYIQTELAKGLPAWGWETSVHPIFGQFCSPWHRERVDFSGTGISLRFATLPDYLEVPLRESGTAGVIGHEFLSLSRILLDFKQGRLEIFRGKKSTGSEN